MNPLLRLIERLRSARLPTPEQQRMKAELDMLERQVQLIRLRKERRGYIQR